MTRSFDVFFDLRLNKRLSKQPWGWWFETPAWSLWRHRNEMRTLCTPKTEWTTDISSKMRNILLLGLEATWNCENRCLKIVTKEPSFAKLPNREKCIFYNERQILTWFGKFLHYSFEPRNLRTVISYTEKTVFVYLHWVRISLDKSILIVCQFYPYIPYSYMNMFVFREIIITNWYFTLTFCVIVVYLYLHCNSSTRNKIKLFNQSLSRMSYCCIPM